MTDLPPDISPADAEALQGVERRLQAMRPVPRPDFRGDLGRAVQDETLRRRIRPRPPGLWRIVAGMTAIGSILLAVAALQA